MSRRFDLQLFEQPGVQPPPVVPPTAPAAPGPAVPPVTPAPTPMGEPTGETFSAEGLLQHMEAQAAAKLAGQVPPVPGGPAPAAPDTTVPPTVPPALPAVAAPAQPAQQVVGLPPELLQTLGQLAMRGLPPQQPAPSAIAEPTLPPLPELPEILKGTPEERERKHFAEPIAYTEALYDYKIATARVQAERDRVTGEHKQKVEQHDRLQGLTAAFTEQAVAVGPERFSALADEVDKILKTERQDLLDPRIPPRTAVGVAFEIAKARSAPPQVTVDVAKMTPEQKAQVKAAVREEVIREYLAAQLKPGQTPPVTITSSITAGKTPLAAPQMPKDLDEAERQYLASRGVPKR